MRTLRTDSGGKPIFYVSYQYAQLENVIDLLSDEQPVKFLFRDDTVIAYVTTTNIPIGK